MASGSTAVLISCGDYEKAAAVALSAAPTGTLTYFASGAGDEETLERNRRCFDDWALLPRILVDVSSVSTATTVLGHAVSQPFGIAPSAFQRLVHRDGELGMARAAITCNIAHCLSSSATTSLEDVAAEAKGRGLRFMQARVRSGKVRPLLSVQPYQPHARSTHSMTVESRNASSNVQNATGMRPRASQSRGRTMATPTAWARRRPHLLCTT